MNPTSETYVLFEVAGSSYGIPSQLVQHIDMFDHVTLVPSANPAIDGVVFSRGKVIPALNLRARFSFPREKSTPRTRLIFARFETRLVGLVVDAAREFQAIPADAIRPIDETLIGIQGNYLKAVAKLGERLILLLNMEAVLNLDLPPVDAGGIPGQNSPAQPPNS